MDFTRNLRRPFVEQVCLNELERLSLLLLALWVGGSLPLPNAVGRREPALPNAVGPREPAPPRDRPRCSLCDLSLAGYSNHLVRNDLAAVTSKVQCT